MDSNRHKRRLSKKLSDVELLDLRKTIFMKRNEDCSISDQELSSTCTVKEKLDVQQRIDAKDKQNVNDVNFENATGNFINCDVLMSENLISENADDSDDVLISYNEHEIFSFCDETDILNDEYIYRYSDSECESDDDEGSTIRVSTNFEGDTIHEDAEDLFRESVRSWALGFKIYQNALKALLFILNKNTNVYFPNDPRTFLSTPRSVLIKHIQNGDYCHLGFKQAVVRIIKKIVEVKVLLGDDRNVDLFISTDGAPIGKSSSFSMWPILCSPTAYNFVQVIGIFIGENKPKDSNEFFKFFIDEAKDVISNGIVVDEKKYRVNIKGIICDAPAKSFVLKTKYFSGYNSCTKCQISGTNIDNTICFPNEYPTPLLRSDEKFYNFEYSEAFDDDYQKEETILKDIENFGLVSCVPLDYMHLVCLGVMRKLLLLWLKGPIQNRLSCRQVNIISERLLELRKSIPADFARKPRPLKYIKLWKATEFRTFLLYTGPVVLKNVVSTDVYIHFIMLHIAIRILADKEAIKNPQNISCARDLLTKFVHFFETLYGARYVSYNVHNLNHLVQDVIKYGPVDKFSAFQFESYICALKRLIRKGEKPLQQLAFRLDELDHNIICTKNTCSDQNIFSKRHHNGPLTNDKEYIHQYKIMRSKLLYLNCDDNKNDCVILKNDVIVRIFNFAKAENNKFYIIGELLIIAQQDFYEVPYKSKLLNISVVKRSKRLKSWPCDEILAKLCQLSWNDKLVVFPILHTNN